jgi:GT2 family glycosyltransferase
VLIREHRANGDAVEGGLSRVGVVLIGRNEGDRLRRCLASVPVGMPTVYVDSGSTDQSVAMARGFGAEVIELDLATPFTAARARNAGITRLVEDGSRQFEFVQVVDGDCELAPGFIEAALETMFALPRAAVVCGRRRERSPDRSIYNALCDMEWDTPLGEIDACGGDALLRVAAFREVGGYDARVIAGEEPELCLRLRRNGWSAHRIDHEMTLHDAAITSFSAWWRRTVRAGHAYAELFVTHLHWGREVASILLYGWALPVLAVGLAPVTFGASLALFAAYGFLYLRVRAHRLRKGDSSSGASLYALFCVIAKFPHFIGMVRYVAKRFVGAEPKIIEYKTYLAREAAPQER